MAHKVASCGAALGAAAAAMALVLVMQTGSSVAFADVLEKMAEVQTLHVKVNFGGKSGEAWAKRPNMIRINYADGTYEISNGPRLWVVDEKANKAVEKPSSYY